MFKNKIGIIIIEALHLLKEPASFKEIVAKVASLLKFPEEYVEESVKMTLEGGVRYGFLRKYREKYSFKRCIPDFSQSKTGFCSKKKSHFKQNNIAIEADMKASLLENTSDVMKTLFKSQRRLRTSCDLTLEVSSPCVNSKKKSNSYENASTKSLPFNMKTGKVAKKTKFDKK